VVEGKFIIVVCLDIWGVEDLWDCWKRGITGKQIKRRKEKRVTIKPSKGKIRRDLSKTKKNLRREKKVHSPKLEN